MQLCRFQVKEGDCLETEPDFSFHVELAYHDTGVSDGFRGDVAKRGKLACGYRRVLPETASPSRTLVIAQDRWLPLLFGGISAVRT